MRVKVETADAIACQSGNRAITVAIQSVAIDQHHDVQTQAGDLVFQIAFVEVRQGVELFAKAPGALLFLAIFNVVQAKGLGQLERRIDLDFSTLDQIFQVAGGGQRVVLRRVVKAAVREHQLQALQLQRACGQCLDVDFQRLHAPMERRGTQCRLSKLMLVKLILILEMLWQKEHAFRPHHAALFTHLAPSNRELNCESAAFFAALPAES